MSGKTISDYANSSRFYRGTNDSFKDEDNASWIMRLRKYERDQWVPSIQWTREPDRLREGELFRQKENSPSYTYKSFVSGWQQLLNGRELNENLPCAPLLHSFKKRFAREKPSEEFLKKCSTYLEALENYVRPDVSVRNMRGYETAIYDLGAFFYVFPFAPKNYFKEIGVLGALDQHFNFIRDEFEDTHRGLVYFPNDLLSNYNIKKHELPKLVMQPDKRYARFNEFMLTDFASKLKTLASPLLTAKNLHNSWNIMLENNLRRYERITKVLRLCNYNAQKFNFRYWDFVRADLDPEISLKFRAFKSTLRL